MPRLGPISRKNLIANLRKFGFNGPKSGGKHEYMIRGNLSLALPNPHGQDISKPLLRRILKQAAILESEWESL